MKQLFSGGVTEIIYTNALDRQGHFYEEVKWKLGQVI